MRQAHDQGYVFGFKNDILMKNKKSRAADIYRDHSGEIDDSVNDRGEDDPFQLEPASSSNDS